MSIDRGEEVGQNDNTSNDIFRGNCKEIEKGKEVFNENNKVEHKEPNAMDQFIKNIPPIQKEDERYIQMNTDKKLFSEEKENLHKDILEPSNETSEPLFNNSDTNEKKEDNVGKEPPIFTDAISEKEKNKTKENIKEKNATLKEKKEKTFLEKNDTNEFKTERNCYSDNCVQSDLEKDSCSSDESDNSENFESVKSSENESEPISASGSGSGSESDSDLDSESVSNEDGALSDSGSGSGSDSDVEYSDVDKNSNSEEDDEDDEDEDADSEEENGYIKDPRDDIIKGKSVEEIKEVGNTHFKEMDYYNAIYYYSKAIKKCKEKHIKSVLYSNRAACNVLLKKWDAVIKDCTKSLNYNDGFVKSYIRRSKAYEQLEKYNDASNDLNKAIALDPSLKSTHEKTQKKLTILAEQQLNKEKEEMMGKLKDFGNLLLGKVGLSLDNFEVQKNPNNDGSFNIQFKQNK